MTAHTYEIRDIDGKSPHRVTLAQFRADMGALRAAAKPISDAWRRGDIRGVEAAQKAFRARRTI